MVTISIRPNVIPTVPIITGRVNFSEPMVIANSELKNGTDAKRAAWFAGPDILTLVRFRKRPIPKWSDPTRARAPIEVALREITSSQCKLSAKIITSEKAIVEAIIAPALALIYCRPKRAKIRFVPNPNAETKAKIIPVNVVVSPKLLHKVKFTQ